MKIMTLAEFEARQQEYAAAAAESNPPQAEEHLSGVVQQLQATPNAVTYKNFTGDHIEETTLLKDEFNQTLNTNITENYAPGVTSTINETAPSINHQVTLSDSHTLNVKNRSETVYSKNETQNINVTDWKVYHKQFTQNIPTKLTHQVTQSSQVTIDKYQGNIGVQRINADTYTNNFGTQAFNGPMQIHSSSSIAIRGNKIIFGGPSQEAKQALTPSQMQQPIYDFHIVNTSGMYYHLTDSIDFSSITGNFSLGDFFEEDRWMPQENTAEGSGLSKSQIRRVGTAGIVASVAPVTYQIAVKQNLINTLKQMYPQIKSRIPDHGGLLLQANYQVSDVSDQSYFLLNNIFVLGKGIDYNQLIKTEMTAPSAIATPINRLYHWEYLFIWVTKN